MDTPEPAPQALKPAIGLGSAVLLVMGGIVGVGVFVNPATVARSLHSPVLALAAWAVGGGIALLGAFVYAELAARFPRTGGEYVYLKETYGPLTGFLYGWTTFLVVQAGGMAAVSIVFAKYLQIVTGTHVPDPVIVVAVLAGLAAINCLGVSAGNGVQTLLGILKVAAIGAVIAGGLLLVPQGQPLTHPVLDRPPGPDLLKAFGAALIPVIFSFGGWQTASYVAGEIKDAHRNLARALPLGVLAVIAIYLLINIACMRALGIAALGKTLTPTADVLQLAVGPVGARLAAGAIALSALGFLSQSMLTSPRVIFAMARDGLFFQRLGAVSEGSRVPAAAILAPHPRPHRQLRPPPELRHRHERPLLRHQRHLPLRPAPPCGGRRRGGLPGALASVEHRPLRPGLRRHRRRLLLELSGRQPDRLRHHGPGRACLPAVPPPERRLMTDRRVMASPYMQFAKLSSGARFSLAGSGIANAAFTDLGPLPALELHADNGYGWPPLLEALGARFGVGPECVVTAEGTAFANHLAMAALVQPGDEVLIETPGYELLDSTLKYLGARLIPFARRADEAWRLDAAQVTAAITPKTRLVVLTNLHNPSGALTLLEDVAAIAAAAARVGAWVLSDEVYLELMAGPDGKVPTAFRPDGNIVVTSSLTKAYGLSGLRCGWILAPADLAHRIYRLNDLFGSTPNHPGDQLSLWALGHLPALRARASAILEENRAAYRAILGGHPALDQVIFEQGTTVFPRLLHEDGEAFFQRLKADYETSVVPGRFFGAPDHVRIGLAADPVTTRQGLERVAKALG
jgi:APA family basic amino acid/polyamine antiporter